MESVKTLPGAWSLIKHSISFYKKHFKRFFLIGLVPIVIGLVGQILVAAFSGIFPESTFVAVIVVILALIFGVASGVMQIAAFIALVKEAKERDSGQSTTLKELYKKSFKIFWPYIWVTILLAVIGVGTTILLIIPGLVVGVYLAFATYALINDDKRGLAALTHSFYYVRGSFWRVLWRFLVIGLIGLGIAIILIGLFFLLLWSLGVFVDAETFKNNVDTAKSFLDASLLGFIVSTVFGLVANLIYYCVLIPIGVNYSYFLYKDLKTFKPEPHQETDLKKPRAWFMGLSIFGLVAGVLLIVGILVGVVFSSLRQARIHAEKVANMQSGLQSGIEQVPIEFRETPKENLTTSSTGKVFGNERVVNENLKFSIQPPQGWITEESADIREGVFMEEMGESPVTKAIQIQYFNEPTLTSDAVAEQLAREILARSSGNIDSATVSFEKTSVGSYTAYRISATLATSRIIQYNLIVTDKGFYGITAVWENSTSAEDKKLIAETISTFKITK